MSRSNPTTNPPVHPPTSNTSSSLAYLQPEEGESSEMGRRRSLGIALGYERGPDQPVSAQTSRSELLSRRSSEADDRVPSPSSAPATPRVTAITHPSQYIHTHHPRRASLTPLGLNVISPIPPHSPLGGPSSAPILPPPPIRTKGFSPSPSVNLTGHAVSPIDIEARRGSATSSSSTLTQTRPLKGFSPSSSFQQIRSPPAFGHASILPNHGDRRRSSLTASNPTLAIVSPTKRHATGRSSRPTTSDGNPRLHLRHRTTEGSRQLVTLNGTKIMPDYTRRGSMPQLNYAGWTRQKGYSGVLSPPRGSIDASPGSNENPRLSPALPTEGFKFGSAPGLSNVDLSTSRPVSFVSSFTRQQKENMDVFQQAEVAEAERQQRAFFDATYGEDGRKARQRLSIGTAQPMPGTSSPMGKSASASMTSQTHLRRASLVLWEKMQAATRALEVQSDMGPGIVSSLPPADSANEPIPGLDGRRGSLPVDIPGALERRASQLAGLVAPGLEGQAGFDEMDEAEPDPANMSRRDTIRAPTRPLPPLLPLSDPGPRLLPSTLALHRANHLLSSRNLQAEPLPHPLPPSIHPPAPVDLAEFDIDFILAGSSAQMGLGSFDEKDKYLQRNLPTDVVTHKPGSLPKTTAIPATPTLNLARGPEGDDTFAKFVGEFDDEYGGRRGRWTFRALPGTSATSIQSHGPGSAPASSLLQRSGSAQSTSSAFSGLDPLDNTLRGEWDCHGAGRYELYASGEIKSVQTATVWRVRKVGAREYELLKTSDVPSAPSSTTSTFSTPMGRDHYFLTTRAAHCEDGGIKYPYSNHIRRPPLVPTLSEVPEVSSESQGRRMGSTDSTTPKASFISSSLPLSLPTLGFGSPKKKLPRTEEERAGDVPPPSTAPERSEALSPPRPAGRSRSGERGDSRSERRRSEGRDKDLKPSKSIGGKLKRALKATVQGHSQANEEKKAAREEKEREKAQSHSWSPSASHRPPTQHSHTHSHSHPIGLNAPAVPTPGRVVPARAVSATSPLVTKSATHDSPGELQAGTSPSDSAIGSQSSRSAFAPSPRLNTRTIPETPGPTQDQATGWDYVPDEAVAMVIPVDYKGDKESALTEISASYTPTMTKTTSTSCQALLVWYVPFNSETEDRPTTATSSISSHSARPSDRERDRDSRRSKESTDKDREWKSDSSSSHAKSSAGLPKFQKLLKRRQSKERDNLRKREPSTWPGSIDFGETRPASSVNQIVEMAYPLPFRSFRVVARVIDPDELVLRPSTSHGHTSSVSTGQTTPSSSLPSPLDTEPSSMFPTTTELPEPSPGPLTLEGRDFPTVLAVCHSRSSGVEFVLEGLDRLGLCKGPSAWGPTGYEEWRGVGLSEEGRTILDILWAGCVCVMGLG